MINGTEPQANRSLLAAALLDSMRAVQRALDNPPGLSTEQLSVRLQEWQQAVQELVKIPDQAGELATLYEIIAVLNSSLDLTETLKLVMDSLIHLTGAERGCLMLFDDNGRLEIKAAQHFNQEDVDAADMELSHTVVREAIEKRHPVLTTNAQVDPRFSAQESVIGYHLRSIVCVPLYVRERVIGALYLDNRMRDGVFSKEDLPLLTAFASQAAVAIENARLYTMTDQALAARVQELTTLQQLDQELNASLDLERVLDVTLSWAVQATMAARGTLSVLDCERRVLSSAASGDDVQPPEPSAISLATSSKTPVVTDGTRLLAPIRYEGQTIGLLDLWSGAGTRFRHDQIKFIERLADHAAAAIENARLYEQVRRANQARSEFVSFVAHELRTPMTSIKGYADMLLKGMVGSLTPTQQEFVHTIYRNVERMQILVSDLQDTSRLETGQLKLDVQQTRLQDALFNALETLQGQIEARAQRLTVEVPDDLPPIQADPARLTQILTNLLSNACKYTPEEGQIGVRAWARDGHVHCAVSDTGVGMSEEDQARLFTKFFRSDNPAVREMPGTGLGLCIVKSLVELQGGEIEVESALGEGTTFTFTVPVAE